jgi:hypothetical protein
MKARVNPFFRRSCAIALYIALAGMANAAQITWEGDTDNELLNPNNWPSNTLPSLSADTWQINGPGSQGNSTLNITGGLTFTGTTGKLAFGAVSGNMTLGGGDITLFQGTSGDAFRTDSTGTTTLASNINLGDGTDAGTTNVTYTLSSTSTTTGLLKITGNISGGTKPGPVTVSFGSTDAIDGNYDVTGNITAGGASTMNVTKRGTGTLTLSGNNTINQLSFNTEAASTAVIRIDGGTTNLALLPNQSGGAGLGTQTLRVSAGTLNVTGSARGIRTSLTVDGGIMNLNGAERISFNGAAGQQLTISSGQLNYNWSTGARLGNSAGNTANQAGNFDFTATQTGGTFKIIGGGASTSTLTLGGNDNTSKTVAYNLSGGVLDVRGTNDTNGHIVLGAGTDAVTGGSTALALSGTGKLISRFNPGASSGGIAGSQASAVQVLSLTGGTLVAGRIDATNLRGSLAGTNGTIVNNGTTIAPGDVGTVGRTNIVGNMSVSTGTLTIDLSGLAASTVFSEAANLGTFDNLLISGNLSLGGNLGLNLVNGYVPDFTDTFKIIDIGGTLSNFFTNVADGGILATLGNEGTFKVYSSGNDVFLSEFTVIPEPRAALLGSLGLLALLRRRRG